MIRGLRVSDAPTLQRLCGSDTKVFLRLGALLQARLALTELGLTQLLGDGPGRAVLADRRLNTVDALAFAALLAEHGVSASGLALIDENDGAEAGWRVIALEDEIGNPLLAAAGGDAPVASGADGAIIVGEPPTAVREADPTGGSSLATLVATLAPALRTPVEGLLAARADEERAAALEQLRYAGPSLPIVAELMPMLLSDGADIVRERAIGLLVASGAQVAVVDLIRALHRKDDAAIARLGETIAHLPAAQLDLVVAAIIAHAARGQATPALVGLCQRIAAHLAGHRGLDRLMDLLLPARLSLMALVRAIQGHDAARIDAILMRSFGQSAELDATVIVLLATADAVDDRTADTGADRQRLIVRGVELLVSADVLPRERMGLAAALRRLDREGAVAELIADRGAAIAQASDTSVYWLLAERCRDGGMPPDQAERLAVLMRHLLRDAPGPHLVAILEQQVPALLPASDVARGALVEPMVEVVTRFFDERSRDLVVSSAMGIGQPAIAPLWSLLEDHPHASVRLVASDLLPLLIERHGDAGAVAAAVRRLLAGLTRIDQARERAALVTAAARLTASPLLDGDPASTGAVDAASEGLGDWAIDALGYLAAGAHCPAQRREAIIERMLATLGEELPDDGDGKVVDPATAETTWLLDERLSRHTENIPRVLVALTRIGTSPHLPEPLLRRIVDRMCRQWKAVSAWTTIWGPGNIMDLGRALGQLAEWRAFPGPLRVQICDALAPRIGQLGIARILARVFAMGEGPYLSDLAGRSAAKLVQLAADKYYADDEWEGLAEVLVDFLAVAHLGRDGDGVRRKLVQVIGAYRSHLTARARAKLRFLAAELPEDLRARLDWA